MTTRKAQSEENKRLTAYAADTLLFISNLTIPAAGGPQSFGSVMADFQAEWFATIAPSLVAVAHRKVAKLRRFWCERVKGGGKDSDIGCCLLWLLAFSPLPLLIECGAKDRDQIDELRTAMRDVVRLNPWLEGTADNPWLRVERSRIVNLRTGAECRFLTSDAKGSHGSRPDIVVANELSHMGDEEFAATLFDNAGKIAHSLTIIGTNAGFKDSWQYRWRENAIESGQWNIHIHTKRPPWISETDIAESKRRNTHERHLRLCEGVWSLGSGEGLAAADIEACNVLEGPASTKPDNCQATISALDLGLKKDHASLLTLGIDAMAGHLHLLDVQSWAPPRPGEQIDIGEIETAIINAQQRYNLSAVIYDPWQAAYLAQRLAGLGVRMHEQPFSAPWQNVMATKLLEVFVNRRIQLYPDPMLMSDLGKLSIVEKQWGYRLEAPRDEAGHCDRGVSLALAIPYGLDIIEDIRRQWQIEEQMSRGYDRVYA